MEAEVDRVVRLLAVQTVAWLTTILLAFHQELTESCVDLMAR